MEGGVVVVGDGREWHLSPLGLRVVGGLFAYAFASCPSSDALASLYQGRRLYHLERETRASSRAMSLPGCRLRSASACSLACPSSAAPWSPSLRISGSRASPAHNHRFSSRSLRHCEPVFVSASQMFGSLFSNPTTSLSPTAVPAQATLPRRSSLVLRTYLYWQYVS